VGIFIFKDYGIPWDEKACRIDMGMVNFDFIFNGNYQSLMEGNAKYHGPAFEMFLLGIERIFNLTDSRSIYLMRHFVNFLLFAVAVLFFYRLCLKHYKNYWIAFLGSVFLVLSPRIFADSFYNTKDLAFLSMVIISLFTSIVFLEKKNYKSALTNALVTAIMLDIRIMGIIIPMFTGLILLIDFWKNTNQRKNIIKVSLFFLIFLVGFVILFWPVLWRNPLEQFILAFKENSKFPWEGYILFMGKEYPALQLPLYYLPFWILISTPLIYILLFLVSVFFLVKKLIQKIKLQTAEWLHLYVFFLPILSVLFLHSVVYDGWRHLYFIYPSFIFIILTGVEGILAIAKKTKWDTLIKTLITTYCLFILLTMVRLHPFENLYFNFIAGKSLKEIRDNYEMDYWGLSYKQAIETILKNDTAARINLCYTEPGPGIDNTRMLPEKDRARIFYTPSVELADYALTAFRYARGPYKYTAEYNIIRDDGVIHSIFDLRKKRMKIMDDKYSISKFSCDYESNPGPGFDYNSIKIIGAYSGNHAEVLNPSIPYGFTYVTNVPKEPEGIVCNKYLEINFMIKTPAKVDASVILQIDSGGSTTTNWDAYELQVSQKNAWIRQEYKLKLPESISSNERIKIYIWNFNKDDFFIDNVNINFYYVPEVLIDSVKTAYP
jgi:hypothetical protein